ncbi:MAG: urea ABC transporter permease subunit UrtB [Proteobacteria bacterium]|nr:urea ABC transporter permease subunit UrtB [Pseudomonadota bacterium]MBI3497442.1 urea ABC transporter permease subunit UrtB [Pseudomonadota bacterium]
MAKEGEIERIAFDDEAKALLAGAGVTAATTESQPLDFAGSIKLLTAESFAAKGEAIVRLTALGDERAVPVLRALADGRLFTRKEDGTIVIGDPSGNDVRITRAATLEAAGIVRASSLDPVVINNNLRNVVREAVGRLGLVSMNVEQRRLAADALLESATPEAVTLLREAAAKETDASVRAAMDIALAAAGLTDAEKANRIAAAKLLSGATDMRVGSLLEGRAAVETDPEVKAVLAAALAGVQRRLTFIGYAANLFQGISLGSVLLLAAIGLAITFGVMGVINMAHGEMIMLGAYSAFVVQEVFRAYLPPGWINAYLVVAVPVGFVVAGAVGMALERSVIRYLYGRPLETLLATWGISLVLQQAVRSIFGAPNREVANPNWMTGGFELAGGFTVTWSRLVIIVFCFMVLGGLAVFLRRTAFGLYTRAVAQNRDMAAVMGIATSRVDALTFGLGSGIAGIAGVALSQIGNVSPNLGSFYIVDSFMVVVFGGVGNTMGTLIGAMTLGIVNKLLEPYAGAVLGKIAVLVAIILFIQKRPRGLFALKGRAAEI